ncbi:MAG: phage integrase family protein [Symploca sp. SIO2G7]|nr:phage integrase family protein [Symploca sp. SIO2G7]
MMLTIALCTGERWGAIRQLEVTDCYDKLGKPREGILFRKSTRKGREDSNVCPVNNTLREALANYEPVGRYMFPGSTQYTPISREAVYTFFRRALANLNISHKGYAPHGTRRYVVTKLHNNGASIPVIQKITGHRNLENVRYYLKPSDQLIKDALALLG